MKVNDKTNIKENINDDKKIDDIHNYKKIIIKEKKK